MAAVMKSLAAARLSSTDFFCAKPVAMAEAKTFWIDAAEEEICDVNFEDYH